MKINPKQLEKMAKKMGIQTTEIQAEEVIIKTPDKDILIKSPQVSRINMMGQDTFQISGEITERESGPSQEDIKMVAEKTGASKEEARKVLEETGDLAEAIIKLKK